jgi:hypothetical protein
MCAFAVTELFCYINANSFCSWVYFAGKLCTSQIAKEIYSSSESLGAYEPCPSSGILNTRKHNFSKTGPAFVFWVGGREGERANLLLVQCLRLALSKQPNCVGVSLLSSEDGSRCSVRNVVFPGCLQFRTMGSVQKPSYSDCYAPSPEPLRSYSLRFLFQKAA